jgi:hypothetical protein
MKLRTFPRTTLAAILFAAIPFTSVTAIADTLSAQRLTNLQNRGATEINRRSTNLHDAMTKLEATTKLKAADKATLTTQLQTELDGLTALKAKLAADTDLAVARADVQSIVVGYRVYALMLPKARMTLAANRFALAEARLTELYVKLQAKVDALKADNDTSIDTAALQVTLDDMKEKIASSKTGVDEVVSKLLALQPTDYNADHAVLTTHRATLKSAQTDLKTARGDARSVIESLRTK